MTDNVQFKCLSSHDKWFEQIVAAKKEQIILFLFFQEKKKFGLKTKKISKLYL